MHSNQPGKTSATPSSPASASQIWTIYKWSRTYSPAWSGTWVNLRTASPLYIATRSLRSSDQGFLDVPRTRLKTLCILSGGSHTVVRSSFRYTFSVEAFKNSWRFFYLNWCLSGLLLSNVCNCVRFNVRYCLLVSYLWCCCLCFVLRCCMWHTGLNQ